MQRQIQQEKQKLADVPISQQPRPPKSLDDYLREDAEGAKGDEGESRPIGLKARGNPRTTLRDASKIRLDKEGPKE